MGDTATVKAAAPWWVEAGMRFLQIVGVPAAALGYVLFMQTGELKAIRADLAEIKTVLVERLPKPGR